MTIKKEKVLIVYFIVILIEYLNDKIVYSKMTNVLQFTMNIRKSPPSCFSLCRQQHPKCEWSIRLVYPLFIFKLISFSNPNRQRSKDF